MTTELAPRGSLANALKLHPQVDFLHHLRSLMQRLVEACRAVRFSGPVVPERGHSLQVMSDAFDNYEHQ